MLFKGYPVDKIIGMPIKPPVELPKQVQEPAPKEEKPIVQETIHIAPKIEETKESLPEPVLEEPEYESEQFVFLSIVHSHSEPRAILRLIDILTIQPPHTIPKRRTCLPSLLNRAIPTMTWKSLK